tara:strand:- start:5965 stop:6099 length:135 start_codon:yes stop_codon:yes gene_type:complete
VQFELFGPKETQRIDLELLPSGFFMLEVVNGDYNKRHQKMLVRH